MFPVVAFSSAERKRHVPCHPDATAVALAPRHHYPGQRETLATQTTIRHANDTEPRASRAVTCWSRAGFCRLLPQIIELMVKRDSLLLLRL